MKKRIKEVLDDVWDVFLAILCAVFAGVVVYMLFHWVVGIP